MNTEPTPAQAEAGNYKKGHVTIGEFDITIENPAGSVRKSVDAAGKEWTTIMAHAYGYIKGTEGADGEIEVGEVSDAEAIAKLNGHGGARLMGSRTNKKIIQLLGSPTLWGKRLNNGEVLNRAK